MRKHLNSMDLLSELREPERESYQLDVLESFRDFDDVIRYHGSPEMHRELRLLHNLTFEAVTKSFNKEELDQCMENFVQKLKDMSYFNGELDVTPESLNAIYDTWMSCMFDIQADWVFNGVFDYDADNYELRVNVGTYDKTVGTVNLERSLTKKCK